MKNKEWSIIQSYSRDSLKSSQDYNHIGGAGMVEWHSAPPVWPGFAPRPAVIWRFSALHKNQHF